MIRPGAIGDFIVSLPALESLRADYTEVWCAGQNVPLARFADSAQSIVASGLDRLGLLPSEHVIERLRGFDSVISWYGSNRPEFRELVSESGPAVSISARVAGPAAATPSSSTTAGAGARRQRRPPDFPKSNVPPAERTFAVIHPFASNVAKRAPMAVFERIAEEAFARRMPVHWLCGPEEELAGAVRIEDLYELACWLRSARIFVGNDSGISHLAAAVGTPVQAFFRTTDPRVWAPRGPSVHVVKL